MAVDTPRMSRRGGDPDYDSGQIRGIREERGIVEGIVKANVHGSHMGVISVFIPRFSNEENNKEQWRQVKYCTPFYSRTNSAGPNDNFLDVKTTAGIITPPPDLGTKVLCFFPDGRNAAGYYFACVPDTYMMQTIPEASVNADGEAATEFNDDVRGANPVKKVTNFNSPTRPLDVYTQGQLIAAGLETDTVRGTSTSTVMRESPSEVMGIASKGRRITDQGLDFLTVNKAAIQDQNTKDPKILEGLLNPTYRKKGHSIALDDGDIDGASNQIRLRTSTGHQILLNDSEGVIYISNRAGTAWVELGSTGTMDVYAKDSINFRTKDFNVHADGNIKMHSKGYSQFVSDQQLQVQSKSQTVISSQGETGVTGSSGLHLSSGSDLRATASSGMYLNTSAIMSIKGSLILLQGPGLPAKTAKPIAARAKADTQFDQTQGRWVVRDPVQTSVDRAVTHEPFPEHNIPNEPTPFSGGLQGGGGGLAGAFSVISAAASFASVASAIPTGIDGGLAAAASNAGGLGLSPGALGGAIPTGIDGGLVAAAAQNSGFSSTFANQFSSSLSQVAQAGGPLGSLTQSLQTGQLSSVIGDANGAFAGAFDSLPGALSQVQDALPGVVSELGSANFASQFASDLGAFSTEFPKALGTLGNYFPPEITSIVTDNVGGITNLALENASGLPSIAQNALNIAGPQLDNLTNVLSSPNSTKFPLTEIFKQVETGFSIGGLDSTAVTGLNAAVVKSAGSNNLPGFVDGITKSVGKYGFNVQQLQKAGYLRPEAVFNDQMSQAELWTGKNGMSNLSNLLANSQIQDEIQNQLIASDYQSLVDKGGIKPTDGLKETMSMLTASLSSSPELAVLSRTAEQNLSVLQNTTNITDPANAQALMEQFMKTGAAAAQEIERLQQQNYSPR